jgi:hypothetical protein
VQATARRATGAMIALTLAAGLTGCGIAPWAGQQNSTPSPTMTTPSAVPTPVSNDLSSGSTQRTVKSGSVTATVNYWSTLSMDRWKAGALKPISLSLTTTVDPNDGQKVYLQSATMTAIPQGSNGETFPALSPQSDTSTVPPGYLALSPYSYSQTFTIGEVPQGATSVQIQFTYDFLVQTTPTSSEYAKQTGSDLLSVAIAQG